jgi:monoamine oxidase
LPIIDEGECVKRRDFLATVAATGGSVYAAANALGLLDNPAVAQTEPFRLPSSGRRRRVIILGAGIAGMASAYELGKIGYDCILLEARSRPGGRCWSIRGGDQFTESDGQSQTAGFARGLYFNPGPARLPYHHVTIDYCRELGVPLEVVVNLSRQQYIYRENAGPLSNRKLRFREAETDMRGYIAELLAKSVSQDVLSAELTGDDKQRMLDFLRTYGALDSNLKYAGSSRRGYEVPQGASNSPGVLGSSFDLTGLLQLGFASDTAFEWGYDQQMTMFEPVGGMDQIALGFARQVGRLIRYNSEVKEIRKLPNGVRVVYADPRSGATQELLGDFCICTIPLPVLKSIPADFAPDMLQAISGVGYAVTGKSGLQFSRRFWEEDEDIYGGISQTNQGIDQIWYPSSGFLSNRGILVGYYNFGEQASQFGNLPPGERVSLAVTQGSQIHAQYPSHFETGVSVYWPKVPYSLGGWATYTTDTRTQFYSRLNAPDGNIYLCGEHLSYLTGWIAGALESARLVTKQISIRG